MTSSIGGKSIPLLSVGNLNFHPHLTRLLDSTSLFLLDSQLNRRCRLQFIKVLDTHQPRVALKTAQHATSLALATHIEKFFPEPNTVTPIFQSFLTSCLEQDPSEAQNFTRYQIPSGSLDAAVGH